MRIGVPKEVKVHEYRVGLVPGSVRELICHGHEVVVETGAGTGSGFADEDYQAAGADIAPDGEAVFQDADMIVKVKEPQPLEVSLLRKGQVVLAYLHLAADRPLAESLMKSGATCIAYETVTDGRGGLPLLAPMSEIAGRMSVQVGAHYLEKAQGGYGILLGGVPGSLPARVVVIGGGTSGTNAARVATALGASVTVIDKSVSRLRDLDMHFGSKLRTLYATTENIEREVVTSELVIGAVLVPGAAAQKVVTRDMVRQMAKGSVLVDISIDQGGCFESSVPTTHARPTYVEEDVIHYCVTNMPGAVPRTATYALSNATLPVIITIADKGWQRALRDDEQLNSGLNILDGHVVHQAVAQDLGFEVTSFG